MKIFERRRFRGPFVAITVVLLIIAAALAIWQRQVLRPQVARDRAPEGGDFREAMIEGRNAFENADASKAIAGFERAVRAEPAEPDAHLNLANACLLAGQSERAIAESEEVLKLTKNSAAALYVIGCANLRLGKAREALQALQQSWFIDPSIAAVAFQIGRAHQALRNWADAAAAFREVIALDPTHPAAHYALSQVLVRQNQAEAAQAALQRHKEIGAARPNIPNDPTYFEKSVHTNARLPAVPREEPAAAGIAVRFVDATSVTFGADPTVYRGPLAIVEWKPDARNSVILAEGNGGYRLLANNRGKLTAAGDLLAQEPAPAADGQALVGDLNNDNLEDLIVLSDQGAKVFKLARDGSFDEVTVPSGLQGERAKRGLLADLDFSGKLGLVTWGEHGIRIFRNQGNAVFHDVTATFAIPDAQRAATDLWMTDWNGDDLPDLLIARPGESPQLLLNQHGGVFRLATADDDRLHPASGTDRANAPANARREVSPWPAGSAIASGDLNGDLRNDLVVATSEGFEIVFGGIAQRKLVPAANAMTTGGRIRLIDYDNDGWLDLFALGRELRVWRNSGSDGFRETTAALGLGEIARDVADLAAADFDDDGDTDLMFARPDAGVRLLRNDGGNTNRQLKVRIIGKRSNASGIGTQLELIAGGWRTTRMVRTLPVEIGVGSRSQLDSLSLHAADLVMNLGGVGIDPASPIVVTELELPTGSCPYLYVWDGMRYRFVTDLLGAAPAGLRATNERFVDADTEELVHVGDDTSVQPRDGSYTFQITDELRELLFFDLVQLVVADHPGDVEMFSTSKLLPGRPFIPHELVALRNRLTLKRATRSDGKDATDDLGDIDGRHLSPVALRAPQLRGLAEPYAVTLDFGSLPVERNLVLAVTGWLRFGGGMANVAASHDPALPFPFPQLEVEQSDGRWGPVDVISGAPAGKTKGMIIDLGGKLPVGARRLRLSTAFEIHWDRIALFERAPAGTFRATTLHANRADLHYRGTAEYLEQPWYLPITPVYEKLRKHAPWLRQPAGWCTRYGDVRELVTKLDDALVILNCGDELTVKFAAAELPAKAPDAKRNFFLFTSGWDKDGDYHVAAGLTVEPIPWHGMDDQRYGEQPRPVIDGDWWIPKYNTRWVGPATLTKSKNAPRSE